MKPRFYGEFDDYDSSLIEETRRERMRAAALMAHPDPRDPDYPEWIHDGEEEDE